MPLGPKTLRLLAVLDELAPLLRALDQEHWADWIEESARRLKGGDGSGIAHLLGAYGGMGSFNDVLAEIAGASRDERADRARALRAKAWTLADEIRREAGLP